MWKDKKLGAEEIWAFSGWGSQAGRLGGQKQKQVLSGGQILGTQGKARQGKWPKSRIIGATDRRPRIRIMEVQLPSLSWLDSNAPFSGSFLQIWLSSSLSAFCKGDCRMCSKKKGDCGWKEKSGQWGSAIHNEDPRMIWENLDNQLRKMLGASRDNGEEEHANLFFLQFLFSPISYQSHCVGDCDCE